MIIGIDPGKANLKAYNGIDEFVCKSTYAEDVEKLDEGYQIEVGERKFLIGDSTLPYDLEISKKKLVNKMLMYLATFELANNEDSVTLVVGCPMDMYLNKNERQSYKQYLMSDRYPIIKVGGIQKRIFINNVVVVPESSGIVYRYTEYFKDKMIGVVDIGGSTINFSIYQNMNIDRDMSFSTTLGLHYLREDIRSALSREFGYCVITKEVPYLMAEPNSDLMADIINKEVLKYFDSIRKDMIAKKWSPNIKLIFTGGGSDELAYKIIENFRNATISETPLCDNCVGYHQMGELMCDYKK